jgi:hypothetical protein
MHDLDTELYADILRILDRAIPRWLTAKQVREVTDPRLTLDDTKLRLEALCSESRVECEERPAAWPWRFFQPDETVKVYRARPGGSVRP